MTEPQRPTIEIGLNAAIVAVAEQQPLILVVSGNGHSGSQDSEGLPFGPFDPLSHRTFDTGLREWVAEQTALTLGHVEQLYTFGDRGRHAVPGDTGPHVVSVGYLALTRVEGEPSEVLARVGARWRRWYDFFPWEDWRAGRPEVLDAVLFPALHRWAREEPVAAARSKPLGRTQRIHLAFGEADTGWDEERALDRYELLYEAGLVAESVRDGRAPDTDARTRAASGATMRFDHRRILATAISRLRGKLKYRPVVFELMPHEFTLTALQRTVEAISGRHLHQQNFRRLVEAADLVEPTGRTSHRGRGRPAALFRFRREILRERPAPGFRLGARG